MKLKLQAIAVIVFCTQSLTACKKEVISNKPPIAYAGEDRESIQGLFHLRGSGKDTDGKVVSYLWSIVSYTEGIRAEIIEPAGSADKAMLQLSGGFPSMAVVQLMVVDDDGAVGVDSVRLTWAKH